MKVKSKIKINNFLTFYIEGVRINYLPNSKKGSKWVIITLCILFLIFGIKLSSLVDKIHSVDRFGSLQNKKQINIHLKNNKFGYEKSNERIKNNSVLRNSKCILSNSIGPTNCLIMGSIPLDLKASRKSVLQTVTPSAARVIRPLNSTMELFTSKHVTPMRYKLNKQISNNYNSSNSKKMKNSKI